MLLNDSVLRDYQRGCIDGLREGFRNGHKHQILMAPTGAGKTVVASYLMQIAKDKGTRVAFVVDRVNLVDQTSATLDSYGIPHGVIQADHPRRNGERIQICSAQTIEKRGFFPDLGMLIVDECHTTRKATTQIIKSRPDMPVIGLTATPFTKGIGEIYTNLVNVTTTNKLVEEGFLAPLKIYAAKAADMTGAKLIAGEWADRDIEERGNKIIGDIIQEWQDKTALHFGGAVKTIVFSATVAHGEELCRQFNEAGFNFQQISYKDGSDERRRDLIAEFRKPDSIITGLVSCEVFTKGFDVPDILCGISARPYRKSLSSHIQQMGRVMRIAPGKDFGLWLCHSGNAARFNGDTQDIFLNGLKRLDTGELDAKVRKELTPKEKEAIACSCGFLMPFAMPKCPSCGKERKRNSDVENIPGSLELLNGKPITNFLADRVSTWDQLVFLAIKNNPTDEVKAKRWAKAQFHSIYKDWPYFDNMDRPEAPSPELKAKVTAMFILWIKGNGKGRKAA